MNTKSQKGNSGQILLIAAFIMAFLLLSAELYVLEVGKTISEVTPNSLNDFILSVELGSRHVVIGSLANISNGGSSSVLGSNIQKWSTFIGEQYQFGKSVLNHILEEATGYSSGVWIDWGSNGTGVSSACANFTHKLLEREGKVNQFYFINITTTLLVESTYQERLGDEKQVNVTISLSNEGKPGLAKQITVFYRVLDDWLIPDETSNYAILDYGNGTYVASFVANIPSLNPEVSIYVVDQREIHVQANATSTQI